MNTPFAIATQVGTAILDRIENDQFVEPYSIHGPTVKLGRDEDNDICILADGVSRHHASIYFESESLAQIEDQGSKNGTYVNGELIKKVDLKSGDIIQIGQASFRFRFPDTRNSLSENDFASPGQLDGFQNSEPLTTSKRSLPALNGRVLLYGGTAAVLVLVYFYSQDGGDKKNTPGDTTTNANASLELTKEESSELADKKVAESQDPLLKSAEQQLNGMDFNNLALIEAEKFVKRGQREFFSKNYQRAIEAFSTSLSLYKLHPVAKLYLTRSKRSAELAAQANYKLAIQYFEALQYQRARYHFSLVIGFLAHRPNEKIIRDAQKYNDICVKRLEAGELFP